jgi:uncharacterized protein DUF2442
MGHPIHRVTGFAIVGPFAVRVRFEDQLERTIDFQPMLAGDLYGPLRDPDVFRQVKLDAEVHTLVWPNGADFDPATLHDWPEYAEAFAQKAAEWKRSPTTQRAMERF